jgi:transketolase
MASSRADAALTRARAWLVTGPLGRGLAFAIDFGVAVRTAVKQRRS